MKSQDYILKKFVRANSAADALRLDETTPVSEVFLSTDKPVDSHVSAIGFLAALPDDGIPFEARKRKGA